MGRERWGRRGDKRCDRGRWGTEGGGAEGGGQEVGQREVGKEEWGRRGWTQMMQIQTVATEHTCSECSSAARHHNSGVQDVRKG